MIIILKAGTNKTGLDEVVERLERHGLGVHISEGVEKTIVGVIGDRRGVDIATLQVLPQVERVVEVLEPYKLASRNFHPDDTIVHVGSVPVGGPEVVVMAGPCAVESREQLLLAAEQVKAAGARILRGGAFKPRSSPYSFQGFGEDGLKLLAEAREKTGLPIVTEVMDTRDVELVSHYADCLQIGARNSQNFALLKEVGLQSKPVLLKRGMHVSIEEWLMSAEYIMAAGNEQVILAERGIRTFETATRNTLDLSAVPVIKERSHLPILVDPTHGTGYWQFVPSMARAAVAAGADALLIEVHPNPAEAWCDGPQALIPQRFTDLMQQLEQIAQAIGRSVGIAAATHG